MAVTNHSSSHDDDTGNTETLDAMIDKSAREFHGLFEALCNFIELEYSTETPLLKIAGKSVFDRQTKTLGSSIILGESGNGQLAASFIRQIYEEKVWLKYLTTVPANLVNKLLKSMALYDAMRGLRAFVEFADLKETIRFGFPLSFLLQGESSLKVAKKDLGELARELGWPKGNKVLPSTDWIAKEVDDYKTYRYLFSASSRAVHFSVGEIFRNSWFDDDIPLHLGDIRRTHQYVFALDCLIRMIIETYETAYAIFELPLYSAVSEESVMETIGRFGKIGRIPMVIPEEFNLREN
ncbi:DUF5677 domain-containing protein, partial [Pseudofrankia asymbiotica]